MLFISYISRTFPLFKEQFSTILGAIFHDPKTKFTIEGERDKGRVLQHPVMAAIEKLASHQKTNMHPNQNFINRCTKASNCDYALTEVNEFKQSLAKASSDPDHRAKELSNMHNSLKKQYLGTGRLQILNDIILNDNSYGIIM